MISRYRTYTDEGFEVLAQAIASALREGACAEDGTGALLTTLCQSFGSSVSPATVVGVVVFAVVEQSGDDLHGGLELRALIFVR